MRLLMSAVLLTVAVPFVQAADPAPTEEMESWIALVRAEKRWAVPGRDAFEAGIVDWRKGDARAARNHWVRADAWFARSNAAAAPREALGRLVAAAEFLSRPEPSPASAPPAPTPAPHRRVRRDEARPRADARAVMEKARSAHEAGEVEKGIRLMRIASTMRGGGEAGAQADAWEAALDHRGDRVQPAR